MQLRDDQIITVLAEGNPKREGTAAHDMWERYERPKMTVGEYVRAIYNSALERVRKGLKPRANQGRPAILWDLKRRLIRVD